MQIENFDQSKIEQVLNNLFSESDLDQLCRSTKFIQRSTSRLNGLSFLQMNVFDSSDGKSRSLNDCCDWLYEHYGIAMTKQSLDERYNTTAVHFLKSCFHNLVGLINQQSTNCLSQLSFTRIQLTDSTTFKLPESLATFYRGYQGNSGTSAIKLHFDYDLLTGQAEDILITDGKRHDNTYGLGKLEVLSPNGLYIRDLGYYNSAYFNKVAKQGAYFLSRAKSNTSYYIKDEQGLYKQIDLSTHLPENGQRKQLRDLYIGSRKTKTKVGLIIEALPQDIVDKRLEQLRKYDLKHKTGQASEHRKRMCSFNFFITNAQEEHLPVHLVRLVYSLRWQIELIFKIWKSTFHIDKVKKMSIFRFECYLYSRLIAILLTLYIQNQIGQFLWQEHEFELSPQKAAKLIKKNAATNTHNEARDAKVKSVAASII